MNHLSIHKTWKGILALLLVLALVAGLGWPLLSGQRAVPENPITQDHIHEINTITLGAENGVTDVEGLETDSDGNSAAQEDGETDPDDEQDSQTEPREEKPDQEPDDSDADPEDTPDGEPNPDEKDDNPLETDTGKDEPNAGENAGQPEDEQPGEDEGDEMDDGNSGSDGNEETNLDLGLVLTWYKYGTDPKTVVCAPDGSTSRTIRDAQLRDGDLRYRLSFTGIEADNASITDVTFGVENTAGETVGESGTVELSIPEGLGYRNYTFQVTADVEVTDQQGQRQTQEVEFTVVIRYETGLDLDLELRWQRSGEDAKFICGANTQISQTVKSAHLDEGVFLYALVLSGENAGAAKLIRADYTTASGQGGALSLEGGSLLLTVPEGSRSETYIVTAAAEYEEPEGDTTLVYFTFKITYVDDLDLRLQFVWYRSGLTAQTVSCDFGEKAAVTIKRNQLAGGNLAYDLSLTGANASGAKILSAELIAGGSSSSLTAPSGSCFLSASESASSTRYTILVKAQVNQEGSLRVVDFEIVLTYTVDLSLELSYTVQESGGTQNYTVSCENGKSRQAGIVYDDQLQSDLLPYSMTLAGGDAANARITSVRLYQSGSGRTLVQESNGSAKLLLADGRLGENTFTVTAEDAERNTYTFTINIPYKHKGENTVQIEINLADGTTVTNETETMLTVTAWSEDDAGNKTYILATGVDTKLEVKLDGESCPFNGAGSHNAQQYTLIPKNPEQGDRNEHTLYIYAEDRYGNYDELKITLVGERSQAGHKKGTASIYIDMTVIGLGVVGPVSYDVLTDEPVSYVIAKSVWGHDAGEPFGTAGNTFAWAGGRYAGTLDTGFYLQSMSDGSNMGARATYYKGLWDANNPEATLAAIDAQFGKGSGFATLWRCIFRNGITIGTSGGSYVGEYDFTGGSGWIYSVGGGTYYPGESMSGYYLQDGDVLVLRYSLAQGWDIGGGTPGYGSTVGYCVSAMNGSFTIRHQLERIEDAESGAVSYVCRCCGLVEECAHENTAYRDKEDGTHALFCSDCSQFVSDPEEHGWQCVADEGADTHTRTCQMCQLAETEPHKWEEQSNSATCTEGGTAVFSCADCGGTKEEASEPKGHQTDNTVNHNTQEHWQKCQVCKQEIEGSRGVHSFRYDESEADWICGGCGLLHDFDGCGNGDLVLSAATCQSLTYHCPHCGQTLVRAGTFEENHSYADGFCVVCGKQDPTLPPEQPDPEPETPDPETPDPEPDPGTETTPEA